MALNCSLLPGGIYLPQEAADQQQLLQDQLHLQQEGTGEPPHQMVSTSLYFI